MNVLVIGARGFIGSALIGELLRQGAYVTGVTRGALPSNDALRLSWFRVDPMSQHSWNDIISNRFDVIYHLGWSTVPRTAENDPVMDLTENVATALRLLISIKQTSPRSRLIFTSSGGTVYGRTNHALVPETHTRRPISAYGVGKLAFEHYLSLFRSEHNIETVCARLSNPYGPEQNTNRSFGAVSTFLRLAMSEQTIKIFGSGSIVRDYIYISDVCNALYKLAIVDNPPEYLNIASGFGSSLFNIIEEIEQLLDKPVNYEVIESRRFDLQRIVLDNSKLKELSDWTPQNLRQGIQQMITFTREHENSLAQSVLSSTSSKQT